MRTKGRNERPEINAADLSNLSLPTSVGVRAPHEFMRPNNGCIVVLIIYSVYISALSLLLNEIFG